MKAHSERCPSRTYYFKSKDWSRAGRAVQLIEDVKGAVVLETLETPLSSREVHPRPQVRRIPIRA